MLNGFDWLRRSRTGAELLATLECLTTKPDLFPTGEGIGPPHSALHGPCQRCWIYPRLPSQDRCAPCQAIITRASKLGHISYQSIIIWGFVNYLSRLLRMGEGFDEQHIFGAHAPDQNHFLLMMPRRELKPWLRELGIYHGADLKGVIQVFPTIGAARGIGMGDILCRAVHHEGRFSMDRLRVRFFSSPYQLLRAHERDREGLLTFEVSEFLSLLEMAAVFRTLLRPEQQESLHKLLDLEDAREEQFYWGRFLGFLSQEAKDMLSAWRIRQWPENRIKLLYELVDYVGFYQTH